MSRVEKDRYNGLVATLDKIAANATNPPPARAMVPGRSAGTLEPHIFSAAILRVPASQSARIPASAEPRRDPPFWQRQRAAWSWRALSPRRPIRHGASFGQSDLDAFILANPSCLRSTDFSGARSEPPANAELLGLGWPPNSIRSGWSIKHLHRSDHAQQGLPEASRASEALKTSSG